MSDERSCLEELAALEHEQWSAWAKSLAETENLSDSRLERWGRLIDIPYENLTEDEKEDDRYWARRVLQVIKPRPGGEKP